MSMNDLSKLLFEIKETMEEFKEKHNELVGRVDAIEEQLKRGQHELLLIYSRRYRKRIQKKRES